MCIFFVFFFIFLRGTQKWVTTSVINIPMDLQTDKVCQKKFIRFIPSINITYHRHNTICNFVSALIVKVAFAVILCQLSGIYRRSSFVGNPISNSGICSNSFSTL